MGSLFQTLELDEGFQLNLMHNMGYDYVAIGNHDLDFGSNSLATIINNSKENGNITALLCSNYIGSSLGNDDELKKMF